MSIDRLPALPLIANDPYFSYWLPADTLTDADTIHWAGDAKPITGLICIDGTAYRYLGTGCQPALATRSLKVTPTQTLCTMEGAGIALTFTFWSPALPRDLDKLSMPVTFVDYTLRSLDGQDHTVSLRLDASSKLCYHGDAPKPLLWDAYNRDGWEMAYVGQKEQKVLCHSGDHITMDWGYLYIAAEKGAAADEEGVHFTREVTVTAQEETFFAALGYDDVASIHYFGAFCRAWFMRNGTTLPEAMVALCAQHDAVQGLCQAMDKEVMDLALEVGGEDYALIAAASWRHTLAAHKLIATPSGEMVLLSKENDSNGCTGTADVSYPSTPLFLAFAPELVNALCRPVLEFASMPVWEGDYAPHDVGRYPHATGQVYGLRQHQGNGTVYPPYYLYPAGCDIYDFHGQMPVEECGNMLIMMETAMAFGAGDTLLRQYTSLVDTWVQYLETYGEDPGEQLCTDDFAGHLAHNINLSAKAVIGLACYARMQRRLGNEENANVWEAKAKSMAQSWLARAKTQEATALTFDGQGWSMKYNLVWDQLLGLDLLPTDFYDRETKSYLPRLETYGLPLDSRADYTKSDWELWCAAMAPDTEVARQLIAPVASYLRHTTTRVPFSDWYDTKTGKYVHFIARSVQGGVYMPMLKKLWQKKA